MTITDRIQSTLIDLDKKINQNCYLVSIRQGLTMMIPVILIGSFALLIITLPVPAYQRLMPQIFGENWQEFFSLIQNSSFGILSLVMVASISYTYANKRCYDHKQQIHPLISALVSLCSFFVVIGFTPAAASSDKFGVLGMFMAIVVALISSHIFERLYNLNWLRFNIYPDGASPIFNAAISSFIPAAITIAFFAGLHMLVVSLWGFSDIQDAISKLMIVLFSRLRPSLGRSILFEFLIHFFWFLGMHGNNILEPVAQNIFVPALSINIDLVNTQQPPTQIFTKTFFDAFVLMGGSGSTMCLLIAIFIKARFKNIQRHAKLAFLPVLFNINELLTLGLPIVLNPIYLVPFVLTPILLTIISYFAVLWGFVPYTIHLVEWTTPIFLSGYTATQSINGAILQLFNLGIGILCYMPFVAMSERNTARTIMENLKEAYSVLADQNEHGERTNLLLRQDEIGQLSRRLVTDLERDLKDQKLTLFYQPQINVMGHITGVEALLRWKHEQYGFISPPYMIALAEESGLIDQLGIWIMERAIWDSIEINRQLPKAITMSINISALQLEGSAFITDLKALIDRTQVDTETLQLEITEQLALTNTRCVIDQLLAVKALGIKLAMDDFGMGHSSIMYMKDYDFDTIKIDGSLVRDILSNDTCSDIIASIVYLSQAMDFKIVAEYVETQQQRDELQRLGCEHYQGYLYSPALPLTEVIDYIKQRMKLTPFKD